MVHSPKRATRCSIAPKIDCRGVKHLDPHHVAELEKRRRRLARVDRLDHPLLGQARPADDRSRFEIVPEPRIDPAGSGRVLASCAISCPKSNCRSTPVFAWPTCLPLMCTTSGKLTLRPSQASPSSSGVTATGENAGPGFDCKKPNCLASSVGIKRAQAHVVDQHEQLDVLAVRRPATLASARRR